MLEGMGVASLDALIKDTVPASIRMGKPLSLPTGLSEAALLERARASYASLPSDTRARKTRLDVRVFGSSGGPLKVVLTAEGEQVTVRSDVNLAPAARRALDAAMLREQLGRLGETPFVLGDLDTVGLGDGLFLPVSALNHLRQQATDELLQRRDWARMAVAAERREVIDRAIDAVVLSEGKDR